MNGIVARLLRGTVCIACGVQFVSMQVDIAYYGPAMERANIICKVQAHRCKRSADTATGILQIWKLICLCRNMGECSRHVHVVSLVHSFPGVNSVLCRMCVLKACCIIRFCLDGKAHQPTTVAPAGGLQGLPYVTVTVVVTVLLCRPHFSIISG